MAVYERKKEEATSGLYEIQDKITFAETHIYGSSRIGVVKQNSTKQKGYNAITTNQVVDYQHKADNNTTYNGSRTYTTITPDNAIYTEVVLEKASTNIHYKTSGKTCFEIANHLGNIVATISDRKKANQSLVNTQLVTHYSPQIQNAQDYFPFGMTMPGRSVQDLNNEYRYGFQNQETNKELWEGAVSYKYRIEDPRLGRFFSVDPLAPKYPHNSTYAFSENRVIDGVELEGLEVTAFERTLDRAYSNPQTAKKFNDASRESMHFSLDVLGAIPIIGEPIDVIHGVIYYYSGNYVDASISFAAIIPIIGESGKIAKYVVKFNKVVTRNRYFRSFKYADQFSKDVLEFGGKQADQLWDRGYLRGTLIEAGKGLTKVWQAHHLIPVDFIRKNELLRKAIDQGFDVNGLINGKAVEYWRHNGSHDKWDKYVNQLINEYVKGAGYGSEKELMEKVAKELASQVDKYSDKTINEIGELLLNQ